jgi:hypothetical protein
MDTTVKRRTAAVVDVRLHRCRTCWQGLMLLMLVFARYKQLHIPACPHILQGKSCARQHTAVETPRLAELGTQPSACENAHCCV